MTSAARLAGGTAAMRAAVVDAPGRTTVARTPVPEPARREVLVRLEGSGVCGSNVPVWEGRPWFGYPLDPGAPGHEGWGVVAAAGDGAPEELVGRRVACLSEHAFAEYDVASADAVVALPAELDGEPFPGEALACALNAFGRSDVRRGHTVAVVGVGFLGALLVQLAARAGATVIGASRRPFALDVARRMGAAESYALDDALEAVEHLTDGELCNRVFEAAGTQPTLDLAAALTRTRGRLVIAGYHQDGPRTVDMQLWNWRGLDVVNAHERAPAVYAAGLRNAVDAVVSGRLDPAPLYTHRFPLDRLGEALEAARARPDGFLKALVTT